LSPFVSPVHIQRGVRVPEKAGKRNHGSISRRAQEESFCSQPEFAGISLQDVIALDDVTTVAEPVPATNGKPISAVVVEADGPNV